MSSESTVRLIERFRGGDERALEQLLARCLPPLRRWARGRLPASARDLAETQDLIQETLLHTFKRIDLFEARGQGAFQAYLRQAVLNRIRNEIRRVSRRPAVTELDSQTLADGPSPLAAAIGAETVDRYDQALSRLSPQDRELIVARLELGLSYEEVAESLGKPSVDAVRKAAQRALVRLANEMKTRP